MSWITQSWLRITTPSLLQVKVCRVGHPVRNGRNTEYLWVGALRLDCGGCGVRKFLKSGIARRYGGMTIANPNHGFVEIIRRVTKGVARSGDRAIPSVMWLERSLLGS